jgi:NAD(P)-dependent dehydrogenase (short-subunit alcohol dehydrogenase family)
MTDLFDLTGKRALVTGGSRGLGRSIVLGLAARGADVAIASRKIESCEKLAAEVEERHHRRTLPIACNVSSWDDCDRMVDAVNEAWGGIDVLVNNAGISPLYESVDEVSEALFDKVIAVNLKGPFRLMARVGTEMRRRGGGAIVNISSNGAIRPTPDVVPYCAAKAGINNMTESMAQALGPTVRVNTIMPGRFNTDMATHWSAEVVEAAKRSIALGRIAEPDEIVGAVVYLASGAASYTTGSVLRVDGGVP